LVVSLKEIVATMECVSTDVTFYLDTVSSRLISLTEEATGGAEDRGDNVDVPQWLREARAEAKSVVDNVGSRFLKLPDSFEINEWQIIDDFCRSID